MKGGSGDLGLGTGVISWRDVHFVHLVHTDIPVRRHSMDDMDVMDEVDYGHYGRPS